MSDYTTQLRWPVEQIQRETMSDPDDYSKCYRALGLDTYPIFDESYRAQLNDKIIRHFYFREIGFETLAQFRWYVRNTMYENMPYFNQLYDSLNLITDPITNQKYTWGETYRLAQGGGTTTGTSGEHHDEGTHTDHEVQTLKHGKTNNTVTAYGKTDTRVTDNSKDGTDTTTYGKGTVETDAYGKTSHEVTEVDYGKTSHDVTETEYGRTQHTVNGGSDEVTEGGVHERVIREDTPMNLIPSGAIENLNYATDVTYTDRNGTSAGVTEYGGTTDISNGGSDVTTSDGRTGGEDTTTRDGRTGGQDTKTITSNGSDVRDSESTENERMVDTLGGRDTVTSTDGGSDVTTTDSNGSTTADGTTKGRTDFERDLDESGEREHNRVGYDGVSPADLLKKYRDTFLNVDSQVIASLETCFFGLWN